MKSKTFLLVALAVFFTCTIASAQVEEITLSTYYPAPYGEYEEMSAEKLFADKVIIGNMDVDGDGDFSDSDDMALVSGGNLLVENNVGIGTTGPAGQLQVMGSTAWDGAGRYYFTNNASLHGRNNLILTGRMDGSNDAWNFGTSARNSLVFNTNTSGVQGALGTEKYSIQLEGNSAALGFLSTTNGASPNMVLLQNGNVGIGTTNPGGTGSKLDVVGGSIAVGGQAALTSDASNIYVGDLASGDGTRALVLRAGDQTRVYIPTNGNVGIGTTNPQAKLDVRSTTSGFLPPRMTTVQRDNISSPPAGSVIYNTDENGLNLYNGSNWQGMGGWTKLAEVDLSSSTGYTITGLDGNTHKMYKVIFQGYLAAGGADRHILIRLNGSASGYRSYASFDGDAGGGNWNLTGFYVGRNGWGRNCDFAFEYNISGMSGRRHVGFGEATFSHYPPAILGYGRASGYWTSTANVTSIWIGPTGGSISGKLILLALQ